MSEINKELLDVCKTLLLALVDLHEELADDQKRQNIVNEMAYIINAREVIKRAEKTYKQPNDGKLNITLSLHPADVLLLIALLEESLENGKYKKQWYEAIENIQKQVLEESKKDFMGC